MNNAFSTDNAFFQGVPFSPHFSFNYLRWERLGITYTKIALIGNVIQLVINKIPREKMPVSAWRLVMVNDIRDLAWIYLLFFFLCRKKSCLINLWSYVKQIYSLNLSGFTRYYWLLRRKCHAKCAFASPSEYMYLYSAYSASCHRICLQK